jgi:DNA-binding MarR family transcriptional regulator
MMATQQHRPAIDNRRLGYRMRQILVEYHDEHGGARSLRVIGLRLGMDKSDVGKAVRRLERLGLLRRTGKGKVRR